MENTSREVYAQLLQEVQRAEFGKLFQTLKQAARALERYATPADLLGALGASNRDYREKDSCLYGLIVAVRQRDMAGSTALTLLLLTVWPALILIAHRLRSHLRNSPDPLADVYWAFLQELDRPTYDRRWKVAANLSMNTAKRTLGGLREEWRYQEALREVQEWASHAAEDAFELFSCRIDSPCEMSPEDKAVLSEAVQSLAKAGVVSAVDALLLTGHAIYGIPLTELAAAHGFEPDAARQRYCRLKAKLRTHFGQP